MMTNLNEDENLQETPESSRATKKGKSGITRKIITVILVIILVISSWKLIEYVRESSENKDTTSTVQSIATEPDETTEFKINFDNLIAENPDTKAWLTIPGTDVNHVVVQREETPESSTDYYYLDSDFYGNYSQYGTLFFDPYCTVEPGNYSQNLIIYGHNMKNGQMFGDLSKYEDEAYYKEHPTITLTTPEGESTYEIFAVIEPAVIPTEDDPEPFYYLQADFSSQDEFMAYVEEAKSRSLYDIPVEVNEGDEILTLSTCHDSDDDKRFVIFAVKVQ